METNLPSSGKLGVMKKVVFIGVVSALIFSLSLVQSASAHFYVTDANTGVKAVFHATPDHNPIAGKESWSRNHCAKWVVVLRKLR